MNREVVKLRKKLEQRECCIKRLRRRIQRMEILIDELNDQMDEVIVSPCYLSGYTCRHKILQMSDSLSFYKSFFVANSNDSSAHCKSNVNASEYDKIDDYLDGLVDYVVDDDDADADTDADDADADAADAHMDVRRNVSFSSEFECSVNVDNYPPLPDSDDDCTEGEDEDEDNDSDEDQESGVEEDTAHSDIDIIVESSIVLF